MITACDTDIGRKRNTNQDSFASGEIDGCTWALVCDGMGGANGGNIASSKAVKIISECIINTYHSDMSKGGISAMLESAITSANIKIFDEACSKQELSGMGTTVVAVIARDETAVIAHAGDSRAYLYLNGEISQVTRDHSYVQTMVEKGQLTADEAKIDPRKNVITRALGVKEEIDVEFDKITFPKNSILLLCSDGLSNLVDNNVFCDIIKNNHFEICPRMLIDCANNAGGNDNITAVLIKNE